jgi:hypothetical protein
MTQIDRTPALKWQGVPSKDPQIGWIPLDLIRLSGLVGFQIPIKMDPVSEANIIGTK